MSMPDISKELQSRCPGLAATDIQDAVAAIPAAFAAPTPPGGATNPTDMAVISELASGSGDGGGSIPISADCRYPECFRCYLDENDSYQVSSPTVCLPDGSTVDATGADSISGQGSYYCKVTKTTSSGSVSYSAEITTEADSGDSGGDDEEGETTKTVALVPLFDILESGEVQQKHIGAIVISASSGADPADGSGLEENDDGELDLVDREEDDEFAVHEVTKGDETAAKVLATADFDLGVTGLNEQTGDMNIIGGEHISVETDGQTIKISYDEDKEDEDDDPQDDYDGPDHPGDDHGCGGGVSGDDGGGGGGGDDGGGGGGDGGVSGDGDDSPHGGGTGCKDCQ